MTVFSARFGGARLVLAQAACMFLETAWGGDQAAQEVRACHVLDLQSATRWHEHRAACCYHALSERG